MSRRKRRVFTQEQKLAAVEHVRSAGKTVYQAAQDLDLTETALRRRVGDRIGGDRVPANRKNLNTSAVF